MKNSVKPTIFIGPSCIEDLMLLHKNNKYTSTIVLTDENTFKFCYPILSNHLNEHTIITVDSGEKNKEIETCTKVWQELSNKNIDRNAVIINLGGGIICDMGGFIASTYKRGIDFIHMPTTLLAMCDASIGGKSGVNLNGLKNYVGVFKNPAAIIIYTNFLKTLPEKQIRSGFAEIIKHALIADKRIFNELCDLDSLPEEFDNLISRSNKIKTRIVNLDAFEMGIRKSLNFGHSIGHAIESYYIRDTQENIITHGEAVAAGMITESYISFRKKFMTEKELKQIASLINKFFTKINMDEDAMRAIANLTAKDKKNEQSKNLFTLLFGIGQFRINIEVSEDEIIEALRYYREL